MWLQFNTGSVLDNFNVFRVAVPLPNIFLSVTLLCDVCSIMGIKMEALAEPQKHRQNYSRILDNTLRKTVTFSASKLVKWNPDRHKTSPSFQTGEFSGSLLKIPARRQIIQCLALHLHFSTEIIRTHNATVYFFPENFKDINPLLELPSNNLLPKKERYVIYALTSTKPRRNMAKEVVQVPAFFIPADLE